MQHLFLKKDIDNYQCLHDAGLLTSRCHTQKDQNMILEQVALITGFLLLISNTVFSTEMQHYGMDHKKMANVSNGRISLNLSPYDEAASAV